MSESGPVAVKEPSCRCSRCLGAFRIALAVQQPPPPPLPPLLPVNLHPRGQGRRDPRARASQILAEELGT